MVQQTMAEGKEKPGAINREKEPPKFKTDIMPSEKVTLPAEERERIEKKFFELLKGKKAGELAEEITRLEKMGVDILPMMEKAAHEMGWIQ